MLGRHPLLLLVGLGSALAFAGCAKNGTVSESQCTAGDWQTVGYRDGAIGYRSSRLLAHQDACVPHGVIPDREAYMLGWQEGIREFCIADNGFEVGRSGRRHANVCPEDQREAFLAAYTEGRALHLAEAAVLDLERTIGAKKLRLEQVEVEIVSSATAQLNPVLTPAARVELLARTKRLTDEKRDLEAEIPRLERELDVKARELERLHSTLAQLRL